MGIDNRTPFQVAQDKEAETRNRQTGESGEDLGRDPLQSPIDDNTGANDGVDLSIDRSRDAGGDDDRGGDEPVVDKRPPSDIKRAEIMARFKRNRDGEEDAAFNGDPNDPEMQYGKFGRKTETPEPGETIVGSRQEEQRQEPQEQPEKRKLIIRGREVFLTEAEILARASQVEAADSYLEESRQLLAEARDIRNSAKRDGQGSQHPEDRSGTQDDDLNLDRQTDDQHPDPLAQAIEEIQFGDPKEAAGKLRKVITQAADESADARQQQRLIDNDLAVSQRDLRAFMDQNPDLAKDEVANVVLEKYMYDIYRDDITKLGVDPTQLPKDNNDLAYLHRLYRVKGHQVRTAKEALEDSKSRFNKWRGVGPKPAQQQQRQQPRVEVNVDRDARRMNIPSQPTRAVAPRPDAVRQAPTRKTRHDIIMDMRRSRGRPVA